jgi:hypothetical protein
MENTVSVHVLYSLQQLIHIMLDPLLREIIRTSLYGFVEIHFHEFEYEGKTPCRFVTMLHQVMISNEYGGFRFYLLEHFDELNDVRMR